MTTNERAFHALVLKGMELGQPKHYTDDLHYHDRAALGLIKVPEARYCWEVKEGSPFLWIVRDCGTELIGIDTDDHPWNMATLSYYEKGGFSHDSMSAYWWDGGYLGEITLGQARMRIELLAYHANRVKGHSAAFKAIA